RCQEHQLVQELADLPGKRLRPPSCAGAGCRFVPGIRVSRELGEEIRSAGLQPHQVRMYRRECAWRDGARGLQFVANLRRLLRSRSVGRIREYPERVADTIEQPRPRYPVISKGQQARTQGQQMGGEIAAVYRRDVARQQWLQRLGIVPIVEMAPVSLQFLH